TAITTETVGSMELHSLPLPSSPLGQAVPDLVAVVGNQMITQQGQDVVAYDTASCPRADGPCTPLWTRAGSRFRGGDGAHLLCTTSSAAPTFEVTDATRRHLWDGVLPNPTTPQESLGFTSITFAGDKIVAGAMGGSHGSYREEVGVFPSAGCGTPSCD